MIGRVFVIRVGIQKQHSCRGATSTSSPPFTKLIPPSRRFRMFIDTLLLCSFGSGYLFFSIEFYFLFLITPNPTLPPKHQTFEITPMGFQVPIALSNDLPFEVMRWRCVIGFLWSGHWSTGGEFSTRPSHPISNKKRMRQVKRVLVFFWGGRNKCTIFFSKCFPNVFPKFSWGFKKNDKHRFMKLPKLHHVF